MSLPAGFLKGLSLEEIDGVLAGEISVSSLGALPFALSAFNISRVMRQLRRRRDELSRERQEFRATENTPLLVQQSGGRGASSAAAGALAAERASRAAAATADENAPLLSRPSTGIRKRMPTRTGRARFTTDDPSQSIIQAGLKSAREEAVPDIDDLIDVPLDDPVRADAAGGGGVGGVAGGGAGAGPRLPIPTRGQTATGVGVVAGATTIIGLLSGLGVEAKMNPDGTVDVTDKDGNKRKIDAKKFMDAYNRSRGGGLGGGLGGLGGLGQQPQKEFKFPKRARYNFAEWKRATNRAAAAMGSGDRSSLLNLGLPDAKRLELLLKASGRYIPIDSDLNKKNQV